MTRILGFKSAFASLFPLFTILVACGGGSSDAGTPDMGTPPPADSGASDAAVPRDMASPFVDMFQEQEPEPCVIARCEDGVATVCDNAVRPLDCGSFGGACNTFETEEGDRFAWCDCGELAEGDTAGRCLGFGSGIVCAFGLGSPFECGAGMRCVERPESVYGVGCECDDAADGVCADESCGEDPDCVSCTPDCTGKTCGDNGCAGSCGTCDLGSACNGAGACEAVCVPSCDGKECGSDGCGGTCGRCGDGTTCSGTGVCEGASCTPSCDGRACGSDGCGGSCGTCAMLGDRCDAEGACGCDPATARIEYTFVWNGMSTQNLGFTNLFASIVQPELSNIAHLCLEGDCRAPLAEDVVIASCEPATTALISYFTGLAAFPCSYYLELDPATRRIVVPTPEEAGCL